MSVRIAIVDYRMGNLYSIQRACAYVGLETMIVDQGQELQKADGIILPGVGAFGCAMRQLQQLDLINAIKDFIDCGKPFLGICLGVQLLMTYSEEFGRHEGLNIFKGSVVRFPNKTGSDKEIKVPQVGWSEIYPPKGKEKKIGYSSLFCGLKRGEYMYFVHSYYVKPEDTSLIASLSNYEGIEYCSSLEWKNVFATQFHPEKSSSQGLKIYQNWANKYWNITELPSSKQNSKSPVGVINGDGRF